MKKLTTSNWSTIRIGNLIYWTFRAQEKTWAGTSYFTKMTVIGKIHE